jgi:N-methylhydantoinase A/oxoprolinase/acetone carboxylase beta subunit
VIRVGFDVGGTFTDFVLQADDGRLLTAKRLTTYPDPSEACLLGLDDLLAQAAVGWPELGQAVHGTTLGSNVVIERKGRGIALVTTEGFRDILVIGREKRYSLYDLQIEKPEPLVDRSMTFEVPERVLADGTVERPLDEDAARALIRRLAADGVVSVAVCFLHGYRNPDHERRFAELVAEEAPGLVVSLSSNVSPRFREYERASTTTVNAYLVPSVRDYLRRMTEELARRGYARRLFIMQSSGGIATAETMAEHPVRMIESGPAAGALMAARYGELTGHRDVVAFDMGGTTAKLSMIENGEPRSVGQFELHKIGLQPGSGIPMNVASLDLVEIGAGGGSIARVAMGTIQVGPDSAGSVPGPVCYGRGGTDPTVTDANLVLGYLSPETFAGGTLTLDAGAARDAVDRAVATPLGIPVEEAAWGIHRIVNLNMELATRVVSIERGHDPRGLALVATGGSAPAHACRLAGVLGIRTVVIPAAAGVASAIGLLSADVKFDQARTRVARLETTDVDGLNAMFADMEGEAADVILESSGAPPSRVDREVDLRYVGQGYEVTVPVPARRLEPDDLKAVREAFEQEYELRYGFTSPDQAVEATTWKVTAYGESAGLELPRIDAGATDVSEAVRETRPAYFPETGFVDTPAYDRYRLFPGAEIAGPAIVEERESTTVIPPGMSGTCDGFGNLLVRLA